MSKTLLLWCILILTRSAFANMPPYFNGEIDKEYRALLEHADNILPKTDKQLLYLAAFYPFSLLDIHPTNFVSNNDKQAFSNFNFGVLGSRFLNISKKQLSKLPSISICKQIKCTKERIERIKQFLADSKSEIEILRRNTNIFTLQQTALNVFRVNNTFYSPTQLITYYPSKQAGFIPSSNYKISKPDEAPKIMALSEKTKALRVVMAKFNVAAITKVNEESLNIIFGGISDNHWGVIINHKSEFPSSGDYSHIGLEYDIVQKISDSSYYYQTN